MLIQDLISRSGVGRDEFVRKLTVGVSTLGCYMVTKELVEDSDDAR